MSAMDYARYRDVVNAAKVTGLIVAPAVEKPQVAPPTELRRPHAPAPKPVKARTARYSQRASAIRCLWCGVTKKGYGTCPECGKTGAEYSYKRWKAWKEELRQQP